MPDQNQETPAPLPTGYPVQERDYNSSPVALTAKAVHEWLTDRGAQEIINRNQLAVILGISPRTISLASKAGDIKTIAKGTYLLKDTIPWILSHPQYICQQKTHWDVTDETVHLIKKIIKTEWTGLTRYVDIDDLVSETMCRMIHMTRTSECPETTIIRRILAKIWRETKRRGATITTSLDAIEERKNRRD